VREAPAALARAPGVVVESLVHFVRHALSAGADGVFLSVRDDWVDTAANGAGTYGRLVRPGDDQVLAAARGGASAAYPVQTLIWADRPAGPAVADVAGWVPPAV
jgi:hypothetical protein